MVFALTVVLLFVVPAIFLWIGRMIEGLTSGRRAVAHRASEGVSELTGQEWFMQPMRPMFGARETGDILEHETMDDPTVASAADGLAWYRRPLPPLLHGFKLMNRWRAVS